MGSIGSSIGSIYLEAFRERRNFCNFHQFFHHEFRLKWKILILMVSPERYSPDYQNIPYFYFNVLFVIYKNSDELHRNYHIKIYQTTSTFYSKKYLMLIKNIYFLVKKWEIQVIVFMIMRTRSSGRIFIPMHYAG